MDAVSDENVTYEVWRKRSDWQEGDPSAENVAWDLTDPYYFDFNLDYSHEYDYWVIPMRDFPWQDGDTMRVRGVPIQVDHITMVDENELEKRLGLQDYWSYVTSTRGTGT